MHAKPDAPVPAEQPDRLAPEHRGERGSASERTGPVAVERLRKDDGRALILYSAVQDAAEDPVGGAVSVSEPR